MNSSSQWFDRKYGKKKQKTASEDEEKDGATVEGKNDARNRCSPLGSRPIARGKTWTDCARATSYINNKARLPLHAVF